jgi:hypothetical protein
MRMVERAWLHFVAGQRGRLVPSSGQHFLQHWQGNFSGISVDATRSHVRLAGQWQWGVRLLAGPPVDMPFSTVLGYPLGPTIIAQGAEAVRQRTPCGPHGGAHDGGSLLAAAVTVSGTLGVRLAHGPVNTPRLGRHRDS